MKLIAFFSTFLFGNLALSDVQWPISVVKVTQEFGETKFVSGNYENTRYHWGIDISEGDGAKVQPISNGVVVDIGTDDCPNIPDPNCNYGAGNWILIEHPKQGYRSFYGHLARKPNLEKGVAVLTTTVIGEEGRSGNVFLISNGEIAKADSPTHLHLSVGEIQTYETKENKRDIQVGKLLNPRDILPILP